MNASTPWNSYRQIATQTAPPGQLILMLFDGALNSMQRALQGFDQAAPGSRNEIIHNNLRRAIDIIRHLNGSLNLEAGGELAWMGSCDACAWIVPEDADDGWLPPGYLLGDGPGTYHHGSFRVPVEGSRDTETIEGPAVLNTWLRRRG